MKLLLEYILDEASKQIKKGKASIVSTNIKNKKTIVARNIVGDDYIIVIKKNNKSNLKDEKDNTK